MTQTIIDVLPLRHSPESIPVGMKQEAAAIAFTKLRRSINTPASFFKRILGL